MSKEEARDLDEIENELESVYLYGSGSSTSRNRSPPSSESGFVDQSTSTASMTTRNPETSPSPRATLPPIAKRDLDYNYQKFAKRPEKGVQDGKIGTKIVVETNYYKINFSNPFKFFHYDIEYLKSRDQLERKREVTKGIFWELVRTNAHLFPRHTKIIFDDGRRLLMKEQLKMEKGERTFEVKMRSKFYLVCIKFVGLYEIDPNQTIDQAQKTLLISMIDSLLTMRIRCPLIRDSEFFFTRGRSMFFAPRNMEQTINNVQVVHNLGKGLSSWTGFHGALKDTQLGYLYNVDVAQSVFYRQSINVLNYFLEIYHGIPIEELRNEARDPRELAMRPEAFESLHRALKGFTIEMRCGEKSQMFKFSTISRESADRLMLRLDNGRLISVAEYFQKQYNQALQFPRLPCLMIRKKSPVPIEFCYLSFEPQKFNGRLPERQLRRMIQNTAYSPSVRKGLIENLCQATKNRPEYLSESDDFMAEFGVSVRKVFIRVPATILPVPTLQYGNQSITDKKHYGVWELGTDSRLLEAHSPGSTKIIAGIIFLYYEKTFPLLCDLGPFAFLMKSLKCFGANVIGGEQSFCCQKFLIGGYGAEWLQMEDFIKKFKEAAAKEDKESKALILFVLPCKSKSGPDENGEPQSAYATIKYICNNKVGIYNQCILRENYDKMRGRVESCAISQHVVLKIFAKIGVQHYKLEREGFHKNWTMITDPESPTLILGIDVSHPGADDRKRSDFASFSVAAVVGNIDLDCMKYDSSVRVQQFSQELTVNLKSEFHERIMAFYNHTGRRPAHIVVYRDGVSESMFHRILYEEKMALEEACTGLHPDFKPTISYLMISKRHHTRFFPTRKEDCSEGYENLKSGVLVEKEITSDTFFDFFLLSHFGPLGTSRPSHYYVLWDDWAPRQTFWQTITLALCYAYVCCARSISQPAPVAYAHLAAKRAKELLEVHCREKGRELAQMTEFEKIIAMKRGMKQHDELGGMYFV